MVLVADRPKPQPLAQRRRLVAVLQRLCEEAGNAGGDPRCFEQPSERARPPLAQLSGEDEELISGLRSGLARLAGPPQGEPDNTAFVQAALDGADFLARTEILSGGGQRLPELLPELAFLVVLQGRGEVQAKRVAARAAELLEPQQSAA